jgi:hypothetical protein
LESSVVGMGGGMAIDMNALGRRKHISTIGKIGL